MKHLKILLKGDYDMPHIYIGKIYLAAFYKNKWEEKWISYKVIIKHKAPIYLLCPKEFKIHRKLSAITESLLIDLNKVKNKSN